MIRPYRIIHTVKGAWYITMTPDGVEVLYKTDAYERGKLLRSMDEIDTYKHLPKRYKPIARQALRDSKLRYREAVR